LHVRWDGFFRCNSDLDEYIKNTNRKQYSPRSLTRTTFGSVFCTSDYGFPRIIMVFEIPRRLYSKTKQTLITVKVVQGSFFRWATPSHDDYGKTIGDIEKRVSAFNGGTVERPIMYNGHWTTALLYNGPLLDNGPILDVQRPYSMYNGRSTVPPFNCQLKKLNGEFFSFFSDFP
jgi:hypothetical protein